MQDRKRNAKRTADRRLVKGRLTDQDPELTSNRGKPIFKESSLQKRKKEAAGQRNGKRKKRVFRGNGT